MNHLDNFSLWELARDGCEQTFAEKLLTHKHDLEMVGTGGLGYTASPLSVAVQYGNSEIVDICLENGANPNSFDIRGRTPLFHAMKSTGLAVTTTLLKYNADVSIPDDNGNTPLIRATRQGLSGLVMLLIENKSDISAKNKDGDTSLHFSAVMGDVGCMKILIENGADLSAKNSDGQTALHDAARCGHFACIKILIDNRCNIDCRDDSGWTPLFAAVCDSREDAVQILIQYGADPYLAAYINGETPLEHALTSEREVNNPSHRPCFRRPWSRIRVLLQDEIARRDRIERREAVAMGQHDRLGKGSKLYELDEGVMGILKNFL